MQQESRMKKSVRNVAFAMLCYVVSLVLQLLNRMVFVRFLSVEYLGINGLFSNLLAMLALSELGIGSAIIFALYKPVSENDIEKIKSLMVLYKKLYQRIGAFILIIGVSLTPFLSFFIKDMPDILYLRLYYVLYVFHSGISYFYTYKRSLIICNQEDYISSTTTMLAAAGTRLGQIVILFMTHNYLLFLLVQIFFTVSENILIGWIADRKYPYLKEKTVRPLEKSDTDYIRKNVMAIVIHKIGDVAVNATDNLILSRITGLGAVGFLSNYMMIFDTVNGLLFRVFSAITASLGNLIAVEGREKSEPVFKRMLFGNFWLVSFCAICISTLSNSFIKIWLGEEYVLYNGAAPVLGLCLYLAGIRQTPQRYRNAVGLFWQGRYKAIVESVLNLALSIPLTMAFGITGVKTGTCITILSVSFWYEGYLLYKHFFKKSARSYLIRQVNFLLLHLAMTVMVGGICSRIPDHSLVTLLLKGILCTAAVNGCYLLLFYRTDEFIYYRELLAGRFRKNR